MEEHRRLAVQIDARARRMGYCGRDYGDWLCAKKPLHGGECAGLNGQKPAGDAAHANAPRGWGEDELCAAALEYASLCQRLLKRGK